MNKVIATYRLLGNFAEGPVRINNSNLLVVPVVGIVLGFEVLQLKREHEVMYEQYRALRSKCRQRIGLYRQTS